ncbi:hypothetical protein PybrP1_001151 [[Pythium] brassicae (nom. inval.)]|nr:hypothetical protein PybrP1_001151 [[Pythium] brassicae (nom. inval.)]
MHRYETLEQLGNGSFGEVVRARNRKTNEVVAIKKMKALFPTWEECLQLRELRSLRVLRHENIVQLKEVVQDKEELYFVFEYLQSSLCKLMRQLKKQQQQPPPPPTESDATLTAAAPPAAAPQWLSEAQIRSIIWPEGVTMGSHMQFKFPKSAPVPWSHVLPPAASKAALHLVQELVQYDPSRRPTAAQALQHRFFDQPVPRPMLTQVVAPTPASLPHMNQPPFKAEYKPSTYAAATFGVAGGGSKKIGAAAPTDDVHAGSDGPSRWTRKELPPASDGLGTSRKSDWGSAASAYDATSGGGVGSSGHRASKQTIDTLFALSPRESESLAADAKGSKAARDDNEWELPRKLNASPEEISERAEETKCGAGAFYHATERQQSDDHLLQDLLDEFLA